MAGGIVRAAAEWALWGRSAAGGGDHLLDCSDGLMSPDNFEYLRTRYSPGTLESWPQIAISWLRDAHSGTSYLAIALYEAGGAPSEDPAGLGWPADGVPGSASSDDVPLVRYFCLPFEPLAAVAARYEDLYRAVREVTLPTPGHSLAPVRVAAATAAAPGGELAMQVAALLLTGKPVCILGAAGTSAAERLRFADGVASLLPYGMRGRLSATTWVSSTYQGHRFRLFFASAPRRRDDHVVTWRQEGGGEPAYGPAAEYLSWLREDPGGRAVRLAVETEPTGFTEDEIRRLLARLDIARPAERTEPSQRAPRRAGRQPRDVTALLHSCARQLERGDPAPVIAELWRQAAEPAAPEERQAWREVIQEHGLLREDVSGNAPLRAELYVVLLALVFGSPLTYQGYCAAEACAGTPVGEPPHMPLLAAMASHGLEDGFVRVLVRLMLVASGGRRLGGALGNGPSSAAWLTELVATPALRREHARLVWRTLLECADQLDRRTLRQALRERRYLADQLREWYSEEPEHQVTVLTVLLRLAYGQWLDRAAVAEILGASRPAPTAALLSAVLISMESSAARRRVQQVLLDNSG